MPGDADRDVDAQQMTHYNPLDEATAAFTADLWDRTADPKLLLAARERLGAVAPPYRVDHLLELGADLHDVLGSYEAGRVGPSTLREAALAVAVEAALLWLVTTQAERPAAEDGEIVDLPGGAPGEWEEIEA